MGFVLRYLATAIVGTLAIYYGLPRIGPLLPETVGRMRHPASVRVTAPVPAAPSASVVMELPEVAETSAVSTDVPADPAPDAQTGLPDEEAATNGLPAAAPSPAPEVSPAPVVVTTLGYTPSTQLIRASGADITHWGVTLNHAPFFEKDGKRRDEMLPGGTLVEQVATTTSSKGEMALCRVWRGSSWSGPYLVATADLLRFSGGRDEVDADEFDVLLRYAGLNARAEARRRELVRLSVDANPHTAPLRRCKEAYDAARGEADRLTRARDAARGAERVRIVDELRRVKEQEPRMRRELESLARQYEDWKANNSVPAADPERDAEVQALTEQMQALRPRLGNFGL